MLLGALLLFYGSQHSFAKGDNPKELRKQVDQLSQEGRYREAIPLAEKLLDAVQRKYRGERRDTAVALNVLGIQYQMVGDYDKAKLSFQRALEIDLRLLGPDNADTGRSYLNLGSVFRAAGQYVQAEQLLQQALKVLERALGSQNIDFANGLDNLASLYSMQGKYSEAQPLIQQTLEIREKLLGRQHPDTSVSLNNLAELYKAMGEYAKAEPLYQEALQTRRAVLGRDHPYTAISLNNLALLYQAKGQYAKAESLFQEALRIDRKVLGPETPDTAISLNNLALLYNSKGQYVKAEQLYQEALRIDRKVLGKMHPAVATNLDNLASLYETMGEYAKAESLFQEALRIRQKVLGPETPDAASNLANLATLYKDMGEYGRAGPLYQQALRIERKVLGRDHLETVRTVNNLATLHEAMGNYAKAKQLFQEALRIYQKVLGSEHPNTAQALNNLGKVYQDIGEYAKAEQLFQEALQIRQKVLGSEHPNTAQSFNILATLYDNMGDYARAEPLFQEALRIRQKVLGKEHPDTAESLNNLAELYEAMGKYAKAEPFLQEALRIWQKVLGSEHPYTAQSLNNLGELYQVMGEYAKAEPLNREALRIRQKVLGSENPITALSLNNLAVLDDAMGEYAKAEPLNREALRIWQKFLGSEHPLTATSLENLALLEFDLNRVDEAKALARQASATELIILSKMLTFTSEQQRLAYLNVFRPYSLFPFLKGTETDLAAAVLRYKGVMLDSIIEDRLLAEASQGSADQKLVEQLNLDKSQLGQLLLQPAPKISADTNQRIEALEREIEKNESQLAQHVTGLGQARRALAVSLEQIQAAIPDDGALIEYLRYSDYLGKDKWEPRYGAIVLSSQGAPLWIPLGTANEIEALVRRYRTLVRGSAEEEELSANLQALYEALWAPIRQALPSQIKRIIISPDAELNFISYATLLTEDNQFLAQRYDLQYVTSGRDMLRELKPSIAKEVVLFANPDFKLGSAEMLAKADNRSSDPGSVRGSERGDIDDWSFASLEGTQKEGDELVRKFAGWGWRPSGFTAKEATKEALLKIHSPYILHLATHGFFAKEDPTTTQTEPGPSLNLRQGVTKSKFFKNPMHRSGLALAGAQTTIEAWKHDEVPRVENDGILTAEDVSALDLQGTWLVTLSACDTGSGESRAGEGVMGLRRGFIQAGAQNLLMTLWSISDDFTVQIMSDFYEAAHRSGNAPEALAEAQRNWLLKLRTEKGLAQAVNLAGPFILSSQGKP
jgi:tetratricopeptide (TPR) repeat protein